MLEIALFVIVATERLTEAIFAPLFEKFELDTFWLFYIAWGVGSIAVGLTGINLFQNIILNQQAGQILTAIVAGGGSNLLHLFSNLPKLLKVKLENPTVVNNTLNAVELEKTD